MQPNNTTGGSDLQQRNAKTSPDNEQLFHTSVASTVGNYVNKY